MPACSVACDSSALTAASRLPSAIAFANDFCQLEGVILVTTVDSLAPYDNAAMPETAAPLKKIAEGREAEMFEWGEGRVLRLYRSDRYRGAPERDASRLKMANGCGIRVPEPFELIDVEGRPGIVIERLDGPDLLTEIGSKPWKMFAMGRIWGRLHAQLNSKLAPEELETTRSRYRRMIQHSPLVPDEFRPQAIARLDTLPDGHHLVHGDMHPANIMRTDGDFAVIDWSNVTRGPAEADYVRSYVMCTIGDVPPGTPWLVRTFTPIGRRTIRSIYNRAYRKVLQPDGQVAEAWRLPVMVGRLAEGIEAERPALLKSIRRLSK